MLKRKRHPLWFLRSLLHSLLVFIGAAALTLVFFLVLPLMQTLSKPPDTDMLVQSMDTAQLEAPDPPPEPEPEEEPEPEQPPKLEAEEAPPLDLSQLELALNPGGFGDGVLSGDFAVNLNTVASGSNDVDSLFDLADMDQKPRPTYRHPPVLTNEMRKKLPGKVWLKCIINQQGRVENAIIESSSDPIFNEPSIKAIQKWRFEPAKRGGKSVRGLVKVPFIYPKS